jgi:hypothetical protein
MCESLSPLWGGWLAQILYLGQSGGGKPQRKPCSWQPPPRPPPADDATHRLRSADPPHKGEGFNFVTAQIANAARSTRSPDEPPAARMRGLFWCKALRRNVLRKHRPLCGIVEFGLEGVPLLEA